MLEKEIFLAMLPDSLGSISEFEIVGFLAGEWLPQVSKSLADFPLFLVFSLLDGVVKSLFFLT